MGQFKIRTRRMVVTTFAWLLALAVIPLLPSQRASGAGVPGLVNFQGVLRDGTGNPVPDGVYTVRFRVYDDSTAGSVLWEETVPVQTSGGRATVRLGDAAALPGTLFAGGSNRFLGIRVNLDAELPRLRMVSVAYAMQALRSDTAGAALDGPFLADTGGTLTGPLLLDLTGGAGAEVRFAPGISGSRLDLSDGGAVKVQLAGDTGVAYLHLSDPGNQKSVRLESGASGGRLQLAMDNGTPSVLLNAGTTSIGSSLFLLNEGGGANIKFSGLGGSSSYIYSSRLGIGTISPASMLHLSVNTGQGQPPGGFFAPLRLSSNGGATDSIAVEMVAGTNGSCMLRFGDANSASAGILRFRNGPDQFALGNNATDHLTVTSNGYVGIGTNVSPSARLHVKGAGFPGAFGYFESESAGQDAGLRFYEAGTVKAHVYHNATNQTLNLQGSGGSGIAVTATGRVGVGTSTPNAPLGFPASLGKKLSLYPGATGDVGFGVQGNLLQIYADNPGADIAFGYDQAGVLTERMRIKGNGNVGIGTSSPGALLHVNGTAGNNTGVWSNLSDRRLKKEIEPMERALETVSRLQPVTFRWKDPEKDAQFGRVRGLIAQDVEEVIPEWIKTDPDGYKRIEPVGVDALLIQAIKELRAENDALRERVAALEARDQRAAADR